MFYIQNLNPRVETGFYFIRTTEKRLSSGLMQSSCLACEKRRPISDHVVQEEKVRVHGSAEFLLIRTIFIVIQSRFTNFNQGFR